MDCLMSRTSKKFVGSRRHKVSRFFRYGKVMCVGPESNAYTIERTTCFLPLMMHDLRMRGGVGTASHRHPLTCSLAIGRKSFPYLVLRNGVNVYVEKLLVVAVKL